jgi:hypothetical protein
MGYKSLFDFAVRRLGYPEDQAYRRIAAMKLIKELPEIEERISSGEISLTHIGLAQSLFRQEKKLDKEFSNEQKLSVFNQIANKPVREAERIMLSLSSAPELAKPDRVQSISENLVEMKFTAPTGLQKKIENLKGMLAHKNPNISLGELFDQLCDLGLTEWNPAKTAAPRKRCVTKKISRAQINRDVFQKSNGRCENCGSNYALEIDHVVPLGKGGASSAKNLRVLCRSCNQRAAIKQYGIGKMDQYIN